MLNKQEFESAFNELYVSLCRYAFLLINNREQAEDIVQDLFRSLWENRGRVHITSYRNYLFRAVKNKSLNYLRNSHSKIRYSDIYEYEALETSNRTQEIIDGNELQQIIAEAIQNLPPRCSHIFYLKRFEELSYTEIAEKLSISVKTVEKQMTIAIRKISGFLKTHWGGYSLVLLLAALAS